ncbi:MAG: hypothetical protein XD68_1356 [Synergistales bacterium 54_24]|nr:MAG: hypothetical protein XD68_1356 [Synergistales bacterium 54_24]
MQEVRYVNGVGEFPPHFVTSLLSFYGFYALHTLIKVAAKPP